MLSVEPIQLRGSNAKQPIDDRMLIDISNNITR